MLPPTTEDSVGEQCPPEEVLSLKSDTEHFHRLRKHISSQKDLLEGTEKRNNPLYSSYYSEQKDKISPAPLVDTRRLNFLR